MNRRHLVALVVGLIVYFAALSTALAGPRVEVRATSVSTRLIKAPATLVKTIVVLDARLDRHGPQVLVGTGIKALSRLFRWAGKARAFDRFMSRTLAGGVGAAGPLVPC